VPNPGTFDIPNDGTKVVPGKAPLFFPDPYDGDKLKPVTKPLPSTAAEQTPDSGSTPKSSGVTPSQAPDPNRKSEGTPRPVKSDPQGYNEKEQARSDIRENESAQIMAQNGYQTVQNPPPKPNGKKPDYAIEEEYVDCYSPNPESGERSFYSKIEQKVNEEQVDIIVLNMSDASHISTDFVEKTLKADPILGLRQVFILRNGKIERIVNF
jgi:hypothetical protein